MRPISLALVGIGGYGNTYVSTVLDNEDRARFEVAAAIDPNPGACRRLAELESRGIPIFATLESFYASGRADLVVLATPIALHAPQTVLALSKGGHVLCEKPLCATLEDARQMLAVRNRCGRHVAIGYQWSFSSAIQSLKADILAGVFGRARRLRTIVLWPRDEVYYSRNGWAGAKRDPHGNWVWDSPVNNACAHYLHNMLYLIGPRLDRSAVPASLVAELYRAHPIENYDTAALRIVTDEQVELLFVVSHATASRFGPVFSYEFERGTVEFTDGPSGTIVARMADGSTKDYGSPNEGKDRKLWMTIDAVRAGEDSLCGIEAASAQTRCALAAQASMPKITPFPQEIVQVSGEIGRRQTTVNGLDQALQQCYAQWRLPSELRIGWARPGREVPVEELGEAVSPRRTSRPVHAG